ncbi:MAG: 30S ribosomal protein S3ae [Thaumarchaeota archaeon]|nr:30S ribosomal protein S3ae [Nitrososphaerota archaeon]
MPARSTKVRDRWREKAWVVVEAPSVFNRMPVAYIPVTDKDRAAGRVIETTLFDIMKQDPQQIAQKLYFQVAGIEGNTAKTVLKSYEYSREYLRSLVRRGSSMVNYINDYTTKDGCVVRIYTVVLTVGRLNSSRKHAVRMAVDHVLKEKASNLTYQYFAHEVILGKTASEIYDEAKKVVQLRHAGVRKTKLIKLGESVSDEPMELPAAVEEEAAGEGDEELEDTDEEKEAAPAAA